MEELLCALLGLIVGAFGMRWHTRRPPKVKQEDRKAGLARYQVHKGGG